MTPDLRTLYLGFQLKNPLVASASPLTGTVDGMLWLEEIGAAAVVMPSLFEEQIEHDELALHRLREFGSESFPEALDFAPDLIDYHLGPQSYLRTLASARRALSIPLIASLNGSSAGGWVRYAKELEDAGADALELNVYFVPSDPDVSGEAVEQRYVSLVSAVRSAVRLPLAVKVGPGFSSPAHMARRLVEAGADGLVLFNRYLRPDIELDSLALVPQLVLSDSYDARIALQWIGILYGRVNACMAASGGVHEASDAIKLLLAGADVVMSTSALLKRGAGHLGVMLEGVRAWMEANEYVSVQQMKGSLSHENCPDPRAYERANYMRALHSYSGKLI
jgi:dihydroorotate dehydrogenase (fumarate)